MSGKLDMTAMYVAHDALRRELELLARTAAKAGDDPRRILGTAAGWELFKKVLHVHHTAEDDALWPAMREAAAGRLDDLALLAAMEAEHEAIDPLIDAIDAALADRDSGPQRLGDLTDALVAGLTTHLRHEEDEVLPLAQAIVTESQWLYFGQVNARLIGPDAARILPWMLDGASERAIAAMLAPLPEPARRAYLDAWQPAYAALDLWAAGTGG
ncbi:hemerythrin domain-containing protein [Nonomuraea diastatica]|uniref:Hemerythrin domain-containing protein n=1 Tax=Nonomuraea diastatica TaxID=1848329 RepID=A0A4R4VQ94_9ACTN|nr:hemerythrin domain-containing protein [Nonomuraea diastatica]TDD05293.1 hemerythrin domain-containing protein [Nonomuraea diastatica]